MTTTCTTVRCYGLKFPGQLLRCPNCAGTLLLYKQAASAVALKAAA